MQQFKKLKPNPKCLKNIAILKSIRLNFYILDLQVRIVLVAIIFFMIIIYICANSCFYLVTNQWTDLQEEETTNVCNLA